MQLFGTDVKFLSEKRREKLSSLLLNGKLFTFCASSKNCNDMSQLTLAQRYTIAVLLKENFTQKQIAERLNKDKSVICREIQRNCDQRSGEYKADLAQKKCTNRHKLKRKRTVFVDEVKQYTEALLKKDYSPEQIVGYAKKENKGIVSIERIYQHIWLDKRKGGLLYTHLRNKGKRYRKRGAGKDNRGIIPGRTDIDQRPKIVEEKIRFGDVEVDLVIGKDHKKAIVTANDRVSGMVKLGLVNSKSANEVKEKIVKILSEWKPYLHTITSDNGKEFASHQEISKELNIDFFFAKPYHSWERGANENLNGLLRQYFPKNYDFRNITDDDIERIENKLNERPRKRFGFLNPKQVFLKLFNKSGPVAFII
jgi:IS30 family transposase